MELIVKSYLAKGPPWLGESTFSQKETVKKNGGKWNQESKKWAASTEDSLVKLIESGAWKPCNCPYLLPQHIVTFLTKTKKKETKHSLVDTITIYKEHPLKERASTQVDAIVRRELKIPSNETCLLLRAARNGVALDLITQSVSWRALGPRSGISDVSRFFRGIDLEVISYEDAISGNAEADNKRDLKRRSFAKLNRIIKPTRSIKTTY